MITRHDLPPGSATPAWLLPIVPPTVCAATGPQLIPHLAAGQLRETMFLGCYAMYGISLPFALGRWAFTSPIGTCVTGATGVWHPTWLAAYAGPTVVLYLLLAGFWVVTAPRTAALAVGLGRRPVRPEAPITAGRLGITATQ